MPATRRSSSARLRLKIRLLFALSGSFARSGSLAATYTDRGLSGASHLRPGYQNLLSGARKDKFDIVLAEALDRISRDQEHVAAFFKQMSFAGIRIVTLAEGEISELHVGLKGTMNALFLKDLADKTRRGLRGRVEQGRSGGGLCYGYRITRSEDGERGGRAIDEVEAAVVRRIFMDFAVGKAHVGSRPTSTGKAYRALAAGHGRHHDPRACASRHGCPA